MDSREENRPHQGSDEEDWETVQTPTNCNGSEPSIRIFLDDDSNAAEGNDENNFTERRRYGMNEKKDTSEEQTDYEIGIDLGTTFSCAAVHRNGNVEVIQNPDGSRLTPSLVFYEPSNGKVYVGKEADLKFPKSPRNAILDAKRFIGRQFDDEFISRYNESNEAHFTVVRADDDMAAFEIEIAGETVIKKPEDISAEVLKHLKCSAEKYLKGTVTKAVISVPAYFSNAQRKATKKAAALAGLTVLNLITEPTAAAIHYVSDKNRSNSNILVFDFGGGTLDISLINVKDNIFEVKAVYGDTLLGGRNFDELLFEHFYTELQNIGNENFATRTFRRRLNNFCVEIKEELSNLEDYTCNIDTYDGNNDLNLQMTREQFETMASDFFRQITDLLQISLFESGVGESEINEVVLVGGSTRIPKVRELLASIFGQDKIRTDLNPDEAVAAGASIYAAVLSGNNKDLEKYKVTEVTPMSLGTNICDNLMSVLIPRNARLPTKGSATFTTVRNDQEAVDISIYEGERKNTNFNNKLGAFIVGDLPRGPAGDIKIFVEFNLDKDGILGVEATEMSTGNKKKLVITMEQFRLSEKKIRTSLEDARRQKEEDEVFERTQLETFRLIELLNRISYNSQS